MAGLRMKKGRQLVIAINSYSGRVIAMGTVEGTDYTSCEKKFVYALEMMGMRGELPGDVFSRFNVYAEGNRFFDEKAAAIRIADLSDHIVFVNA